MAQIILKANDFEFPANIVLHLQLAVTDDPKEKRPTPREIQTEKRETLKVCNPEKRETVNLNAAQMGSYIVSFLMNHSVWDLNSIKALDHQFSEKTKKG